MAVAKLEHVSRRFGTKTALNGVDLELHPGEILGLLGPNGAGKTTAVAILLGLRVPDSGRAVLLGRNPRETAARRNVGVVLQDVGFPELLRVREVADLVAAHHPDPAEARAVLGRLGVDGLADRRAGGLSGGERRRVALALALIGRPRVLVLDEPTAGLDAAARRRLWRELDDFGAAGGAVLFTTHRLDEAEEFASRLVFLVGGRVVLTGTVRDARAYVGLARVVVRASALPPLRSASAVDSHLDRHIVFTHDADAVIAELAGAGVPRCDLHVSELTLEEAFLAMTDEAP